MSDKTAQKLLEGLAKSSSITHLDLSHPRNDVNWGEETIIALANVVGQHTSLNSLDLSTLNYIPLLLYLNTYNNWLLLGRNKIGDVGGKAIGEALLKNQSLTRLDLGKRLYIRHTNQLLLCIGENTIADVGAKAIGETLQGNQSLTQLDLSKRSYTRSINQLLLCIGKNQIGDVGANAIAEGLLKNQSLAQLDLSNLCYIQ